MIEIKLRVIHEWRPGHAPHWLDKRSMEFMDDITTRLTTSVDNLATALGNQTVEIGNVAAAIRNHPASTTDNGALTALAERLDSITASVTSSVSQLQGLTVEENSEDTGAQQPAPVAEPPATEPPATEPPASEQPPADPAPDPAPSSDAPPADVPPADAPPADALSGDVLPPESETISQ